MHEHDLRAEEDAWWVPMMDRKFIWYAWHYDRGLLGLLVGGGVFAVGVLVAVGWAIKP